MSAAFTPGPWKALKAFRPETTFRVFWEERGCGWLRERRLDRDTSGGFSEADARLIAAAPELYGDNIAAADDMEETALAIENVFPVYAADLRDSAKRLRATAAKARGEQ